MDTRDWEIINLTPHELVIYDQDGENVLRRISSRGSIRLEETVAEASPVDGVPVVCKEYEDANDDLPSFAPGTILVVSKMVMDAYPDRIDLYCPDTGPDSAIRDEDGRIVGVRRLQISR